VDGEQNPIEMVLSCIFNSEDSTLVKSTFTDANGEFFFENIAGKNYFLSFSSLGFASYSSDNIDLPTDFSEWRFPNNIILFATAQTTGEVVITAMQSFIEIKADKKANTQNQESTFLNCSKAISISSLISSQ
jgi:hypothetical protein